MLRLLVSLRWLTNIYLYFNIVGLISSAMYYFTSTVLEYNARDIQFWSLWVLFSFLAIGYIVKSSSRKMDVRLSYFITASSLATISIFTLYEKELITNWFTNNVFIFMLTAALLFCIVYKYFYKRVIYSIIFKNSNEIDLSIPKGEVDVEIVKDIMLNSIKDCVKKSHKDKILIFGKQFKRDTHENVSAVFELFLTKKILGIVNIKLMELELNYTK
ncbi:TPA: hypothetical protein ACGOR8_001988 [Streptococcus suis]